MKVPEELKYTETHEWVRIEDDVLTMGITEFAVTALSDLVYIDMPEVGDLTEKGHPFAEIESVKAVADVMAPISGEIDSVNEDLADNLDSLSKDPYGKGWLAKIQISYPNELPSLLSAEQYRQVLAKAEAEGH